jgi:pantoate--beta-alanine ligase
VTTVVAKLLSSTGPQLLFMGQKDAQQAVVVQRMVRDLDFDVEVVTVPTVREPDGLALSSRNAYLSESERERASAIGRALATAARRVADGESLDAALAAARKELEAAGIEPEYLEARDAENLGEVESIDGRPVLIAVAARVGAARLIDNVLI